MKKSILGILMLIVMTPILASAQQQPSVFDRIKLQQGPCISDIGNIAQMNLPEGYVFSDGNDTRILMEEMHNIASGKELGLIAPRNFSWFVIFEFDEVGYVKDDEKSSLNADAILKNIQERTEKANEERTKRGWSTMTVTGWLQPPRYNPDTHNLEWAVNATSSKGQVTNWNTRLLGRQGVMRVTLVEDAQRLTDTLPAYTKLMNEGFSFKTGAKYADFRQGDKVAKYGLTALVVGGAAAVATKTGLLKSFWKVILVGGIAILGLLKKIFVRKGKKMGEPNQNE